MSILAARQQTKLDRRLRTSRTARPRTSISLTLGLSAMLLVCMMTYTQLLFLPGSLKGYLVESGTQPYTRWFKTTRLRIGTSFTDSLAPEGCFLSEKRNPTRDRRVLDSGRLLLVVGRRVCGCDQIVPPARNEMQRVSENSQWPKEWVGR